MRRVGIIVAAGAGLATALVLAAIGVGEDPAKLSDWQAFALGAVQGFTELLPISSSGHLILVPWLFGWTYLEQNPDFNKTFDVALHLGTLVAVVAYFWRDLGSLIVAWVRSVRARSVSTDDERVAWFVVIATIPAIIAGAALESAITDHLGQPWQIAIFLAVFAIVLWLADRTPERRTMRGLGYRRAFIVGIAQALALAPGVSRSGITISAGRFFGLNRDHAARFSFLLLVPVTLGAVVYKGVNDVLIAGLPAGSGGPFVVGTIVAAVTGFAAISVLLDYVRRHTYSIFVIFRLAVALFVLLLIATGVRSSTF
jgi:undecaprenyl-diphosphatase